MVHCLRPALELILPLLLRILPQRRRCLGRLSPSPLPPLSPAQLGCLSGLLFLGLDRRQFLGHPAPDVGGRLDGRAAVVEEVALQLRGGEDFRGDVPAELGREAPELLVGEPHGPVRRARARRAGSEHAEEHQLAAPLRDVAEVDHLVDAAGAHERLVQLLGIVGRHEHDAPFLRRDAVQHVEQPRERAVPAPAVVVVRIPAVAVRVAVALVVAVAAPPGRAAADADGVDVLEEHQTPRRQRGEELLEHRVALHARDVQQVQLQPEPARQGERERRLARARRPVEQEPPAVGDAALVVEHARPHVQVAGDVGHQGLLDGLVKVHRLERARGPQDGRVPLLVVRALAGGADRDEGLALLVGELAARLEEALDGLDRPAETRDDERLVALGRARVLGRRRPRPPVVARRDAAHHEHVALVDEPGGAEGGQVLHGHALLVAVVVALLGLRGPVPPVGVDGLGGGRQDARAPPGEHVGAQPAEHLVVEAVVAGDGDGGREEAHHPPVDPVPGVLQAPGAARRRVHQGRDGEQRGQVDAQPLLEEVVEHREARDAPLELPQRVGRRRLGVHVEQRGACEGQKPVHLATKAFGSHGDWGAQRRLGGMETDHQ